MIAGDHCTRACGFCAVKTAKPLALEADEPARVAEATRRMKLNHVVITAVARDDLPDGGAEHFRQTIEKVRELNPGIVIEVLVPDFLDRDEAIDSVLAASPHIYNHNLETVRRLTPAVRHRATYDRSLGVLAKVKDVARRSIYTKSGIMLGLGETEEELMQAHGGFAPRAMRYFDAGPIPSADLAPFAGGGIHRAGRIRALQGAAEEMGFVHVASGPMVRSSYHADEFTPSALLADDPN